MVEAGCIDQETSGAVPAQEEREEIPVGDSLAGSLDSPNETDLFQFQAEVGVKYVIEVAWQDMPEITIVVKDAPDPVANSFRNRRAVASPLIVRWVAEESKTHHIDVFSGEATGSYTVSVSIDASPESPAGVSAAWEGSAIKVSWNPVEGAEYYNVYYGRGYACSLDAEGNPSWCDELAANVVDASYTHASSSTLLSNHYWVVACSSEGCSAIDSANPATPGARPTPPSPTNQRYAILGGGSQVRVTWDAVDGADFYNVYHNNHRSCSVDSSGSSSCDELDRRVRDTIYFHTSPDPQENYYWVAACNRDACSEVESENPATLESTPTQTPTPAGSGMSTPTPTQTPTPTPRTTATPTAVSPCEGRDRDALVAIYSAMDGANWRQDRNWLSERPLRQWHGVTAGDDGCVTRLDLRGNELMGRIPAAVGSLSELKALDLRDNNRLSGPIPSELGNLSSLEQLHLSDQTGQADLSHALSGVIPAELGNLTNLRVLDLSFQRLSGELPHQLGDLVHLEVMNIGSNELSGAIPPTLGNLPAMRVLSLANNDLSGKIPTELGSLTGLKSLNLGNNALSGEIPPELSRLPRLTMLILSKNRLTGQVPARLGLLSSLTTLRLEDNNLVGGIPSELSGALALKELILSGNQLSGKIPPELGVLLELESLDLKDNDLSGEIPKELAGLSSLTRLFLGGNQFTGCIPQELRNLVKTNFEQLKDSVRNRLGLLSSADSSDLERLGLPFCTIPANQRYAVEGSTIRVSWGAVDGADYYTIYHDDFFDSACGLSGDGSPNFCEELDTNVVETTYVHADPEGDRNYYWVVACNNEGCTEIVSDNRAKEPPVERDTATATTPSGAAASDRAVLVALYNATDGQNWFRKDNWLSDSPLKEWEGVGTDPLGHVTELRLYNNGLIGEIPVELGQLSNLRILLLYGTFGNGLIGEIPVELGQLSNLRILLLYGTFGNELIGEIPVELSQLSNLEELNLSANDLSGEIPAELGQLSNLTELELYANDLSGEMPAELGQLSNLKRLILFGNELSGEIPAELGQLSNLTRLRLDHNRLSGEIPAELGQLSNLDVLYLHDNRLGGGIPAELGELSNLTELKLSDNELSGEIPAELGQASNLELLDLRNNQLSGEIPAELGQASNLRRLYLNGNDLSGCIPAALRDVRYNDFDRLGLTFCASDP